VSYKPLGLEDLMPFGKFKGTKVRVLIYEDVAYMTWCIDNTGLQLDNIAFEKYQQVMSNVSGDHSEA
jgi:phage terminase large subunit-like protein